MVAVSSTVILLLIFGLGLSGANYSTCRDTLIDNGYNLSESAYYEFYEAANDPTNIEYINSNSEYFSEQWGLVESVPTTLPDYDHDNVESVPTTLPDYDHDNVESVPTSPSDYTIDEWMESYPLGVDPVFWWSLYFFDSVQSDIHANSVDLTYSLEDNPYSSYINANNYDLDFYASFGKQGKMVEDGHGGYYIGTFDGDTTGANLAYYTVYHYDKDGNRFQIFQGTVPFLATEDDSSAYGVLSIYYDYYVVENEDGSQTVYTYVDKKNKHPTLGSVTNQTVDDYTFRFNDERTGEIEEVKGDTTAFPINPDGSITLPDGTTVFPNADGTYTVGGTDYKPTTDLTGVDINDLLDRLLELQNRVNELENQLEFEKENARDEALQQAIDEAASSYEGSLSEFILNSRVTQVFPFCLPFDLIRGFMLMSTDPVTPVFELPFHMDPIGTFPGFDYTIKLDFGNSMFSTLVTICRWFTTIEFLIGLTVLTRKVVKGAGT